MNTRGWTYVVWLLAAASLSMMIVALQPSTVRPLPPIESRPIAELAPPLTVDIGTAWLGPVAAARRGPVVMRGAHVIGSTGDDGARPLSVARHQAVAPNPPN
jgi:hypothetical protein